MLLNFLPNDKSLVQFKSKGFADDKINVTEKLKFVFGRVANIVGLRENAGYQHFLFSHNVFNMLPFQGLSKSRLCGKELNYENCLSEENIVGR